MASAKKATLEEALKESEERFTQFFENGPHYCYLISTKGEIINVNKAALDALGYKKKELVGKSLKIIYAPEAKKKVKKLFAKWKKKGILRNEEVTIVSKKNEKRNVILNATTLRDEHGRILYSILIQRDITEEKHSEKALREKELVLRATIDKLNKALDELKTLDTMKTDFLARTSHELKTPVTPLMIQLQLLKRGDFGSLNKEQLESIEMIERNLKRLNTMISGIFDLSRIQRGKLKLNKKMIDLNELIEDTLETMRSKALGKKVVVIQKLGKIPKVECDSDKMSSVLINLLDNTLKFVEVNGMVWVETRKKNGNVIVSIKDDGPGIDKENLEKIFKPFTQLENLSSRRGQGSGLGLNICKELVNLHSGKIWAESKGLGKGTTFYFSIPLKKEETKGGKKK